MFAGTENKLDLSRDYRRNVQAAEIELPVVCVVIVNIMVKYSCGILITASCMWLGTTSCMWVVHHWWQVGLLLSQTLSRSAHGVSSTNLKVQNAWSFLATVCGI